MKYARETMELLCAFPGRQFRIGEVIRYVKNGRELTTKERSAINVGVHRVLKELEATGTVEVTRPQVRGGFSLYAWKTIT